MQRRYQLNTIVVLGAGFVVKPMVDYFIDTCECHVIVADMNVARAREIVAGRHSGTAICWKAGQRDILDEIVKEADLVVSMLPPSLHPGVASTCVRLRKHLITTSYISPEMSSFDGEARSQDILLLNEIGEDPGLDHMGACKAIDEAKAAGGIVTKLDSYGAGLPAMHSRQNPFRYKFSWSPKGLMAAVRASATYLRDGNRIEVPGSELLSHHQLVTIKGIGTFETYPNRDCTRYLKPYGLADNISFYRGLLRFPGWCDAMGALIRLGLLDDTITSRFHGKSYADFLASRINLDTSFFLRKRVAAFLDLEQTNEIMESLEWLGLFEDSAIPLSSGTNADILLDLMLKKMSYRPGEQDMILVHSDILAKFPNRLERRTSRMLVEGIPCGGTSAMSRAVALPAAIASRLLLEGKIAARGVHLPTLPEISEPVLEKMAALGFEFKNTVEVL